MKTNKELSVEQENHIANILGGRRTKASGAAKHDPGDVVTPIEVVDCKVTRLNSICIDKKIWTKIREEAHTGRHPAIALRWVDENDKVIYDLVAISLDDYERTKFV